MTAGYGQVSTGYVPAVLIGTMLLLIAGADLIVAVRRARRRGHDVAQPAVATRRPPESSPIVRCRRLIAEAIIVRERMAGQIDVETYLARMAELADEAVRERDPHRDAH